MRVPCKRRSWGGDVTFARSGTIIVPEIILDANTTINAGVQPVTLSGNDTNPVLRINGGVKVDLINLRITKGWGVYYSIIGNSGSLTISNCILSGNRGSVIGDNNEGTLTIINSTLSGNSSTDIGTSGAIVNGGIMTISDSTVSGNNSATFGGAIGNSGSVTISNSILSGNSSTYGGAIDNRRMGLITITNSTLSENIAQDGGGIFNEGALIISNSTLSGNSAFPPASEPLGIGSGGAIDNNGGTVTISNSTISSNLADSGGGIRSSGPLTITNSTLSGNLTEKIYPVDYGCGFRDPCGGGGILNTGAMLTISNSTLSDNSAKSQGGGISNFGYGIAVATVRIGSSLMIGNTAPYGNEFFGTGLYGRNEYSIFTSQGYNLFGENGDAGGAVPAANDWILAGAVATVIRSLDNNGGPTQTHALLASGPATDRIPSGINGCGTDITTDQRGEPRPQPQGGNCDIGAYEVAVVADHQPPVVSDLTAAPNPTPANKPAALTAMLDDRTTGNSHIASAEYNVDGGAWTPMSATDGAFDSPLESVTATLTFAPSQAGTRTLCVHGTDAFNNVSTEACTTVTVSPVDNTPPVITPTVSGTLGNNGWYTSNVTVNWTVTDDQSPITAQTGCDPSAVTADTAGDTFTCSATSGGGGTSQSVTIQRDTILPTITGNASPAPNAIGWRNSAVTVNFTCTDVTSGIAACTAPITLGEGANQTANGTATDNAGHTATAQVTDINVDRTAPAVSVTGITNGATYTLGSVPKGGCETTDALSGVDSYAALTGEDPNHVGTFTASCTGAMDKAGNAGATASVTYQVTSAPPPPSTFVFNPFSVNQININQRFKTLFLLSTFTLGQGSDGINPVTEPVKLVIANFTTTIPANKFRKGPAGVYAYIGTINNVSIQALIAPLGNNRFGFQATAYGADLTGTTNPVTVILTIGNDSGTTLVNNAIIR